MAGMTIGQGSHIYQGAEIRSPAGVVIGQNSSIGHHAVLDGRGGLTIGDSVNLSSGVWIWTVEHQINSPTFAAESSPVVFEDYVWLSCRVTVLPGVTVGKGAVVAAGAVVTEDFEAYSIVAGVPAKKIGERIKNLNYRLNRHIPMI